MTYTYHFPTSIRFGAGVIKELPAYLKEHQYNKPLLVTDPIVEQLPFFQKIISHLKAENIHAVTFSDIHKNPVKSDVMAGRGAYVSADRNIIIGVGGGASMDVARAIALSINHTEDLFYYDDLEGGSIYVTNPVPPLVTVPTTSGTGSEVGRSAVISEDKSKRKRILFHPNLLACKVFADPELTYALPAHITASTGMDALTHNIEAYLSKGFHPMADGIALEGIKLVFNSLRDAVHKPSPQSRADMMIASLMGAVAFQKGLGIVHSLAHPLSTLLDMHHGLANAIMLPYGLAYNQSVVESRLADMAKFIDLPNATAEGFITAIESLVNDIGIPSSLSSQGVGVEHIPLLSELAVKDFCLPSNPKEAGYKDFVDIYQKAI